MPSVRRKKLSPGRTQRKRSPVRIQRKRSPVRIQKRSPQRRAVKLRFADPDDSSDEEPQLEEPEESDEEVKLPPRRPPIVRPRPPIEDESDDEEESEESEESEEEVKLPPYRYIQMNDVEDQNQDCGICLQKLVNGTPIGRTPCRFAPSADGRRRENGHYLHIYPLNCLRQMRDRRCPACRCENRLFRIEIGRR